MSPLLSYPEIHPEKPAQTDSATPTGYRYQAADLTIVTFTEKDFDLMSGTYSAIAMEVIRKFARLLSLRMRQTSSRLVALVEEDRTPLLLKKPHGNNNHSFRSPVGHR
jgi:hypothetical protein